MCCAPRQSLPRSREGSRLVVPSGDARSRRAGSRQRRESEAWCIAMERQRLDAARRDEKKGRRRGNASREMSPGERHGLSSLSGFGAIGSAALARLFSIRLISGLVRAH